MRGRRRGQRRAQRPFRFSDRGTKFAIFAQPRTLGFEPETVSLRARPGSIAAGPRDRSIHVIDARHKFSYRRDDTLAFRAHPPYRGPRFPGARPRRGHFDHLGAGSRAFEAAATFAVVRITLEIWEHYLRRRVPWHFRGTFGPSLEVIPRVRSNNAWSGDGYLEFGYPDYPDPGERQHPFCTNFEVVAHETGHLILKSVIGTMPDDEKSLMHRAHEEAAADLVAVLAALQFETVLAFALERTRGKLFSINPISRIGAWGPRSFDRLRTIFNGSTMSDVRARRNLDKYVLARPFAGGAFDTFVEIFEGNLVDAGAISSRLAAASRHAPHTAIPRLQRQFDARYALHPAAFRRALVGARDTFARLLAATWTLTGRDGVTFAGVVTNMLAADRALSGARSGRYGDVIRRVFAAREIEPHSSR